MKTIHRARKSNFIDGNSVSIGSVAGERSDGPPESSNGVYITDCEGPITKNDNAYELSTYFIPNGDRLFSVLSRYDDVLAYIYRRKGYRAGNTLKLVVPFLKAYGATNQKIATFCRKNVFLVPEAGSFLEWVSHLVPTFLISTSYEPYIDALCDLLGFPKGQTFSTGLDLDSNQLSKQEVDFIKNKSAEILQFPMIPEAESECSEETTRTVRSIDSIFEELSRRGSGMIMDEVNPVGGEEKAKLVLSIVKRLGAKFEKTVYVGDSITDVDALRLIVKNNGLAVSFNGNRYAVENAEIAVVSRTAETLKTVVSIFLEGKRQEMLELIHEWDNTEYPKLFVVTPGNVDVISEESSRMRKSLRGEQIGALG